VSLRLVCRNWNSLLNPFPAETRFEMNYSCLRDNQWHVKFFKQMTMQSQKMKYLHWFLGADGDNVRQYLLDSDFGRHLVDLTFHHLDDGVQSTVFSVLASNSRNLQHLSFHHLYNTVELESLLQEIGRVNPQLQSLNLSHCSVAASFFQETRFVKNFSNLKRFSMKHNGRVEGTDLGSLAKLSNLQELVITGSNLTNEWVRYFLKNCQGRLEVLKIQWFVNKFIKKSKAKLNAKLLLEFAASHKGRFLRNLRSNWACGVNADSLRLLVDHPSLQILTLKNCDPYTEDLQNTTETIQMVSLLQQQGIKTNVTFEKKSD
jgi:hypothetical protein